MNSSYYACDRRRGPGGARWGLAAEQRCRGASGSMMQWTVGLCSAGAGLRKYVQEHGLVRACVGIVCMVCCASPR